MAEDEFTATGQIQPVSAPYSAPVVSRQPSGSARPAAASSAPQPPAPAPARTPSAAEIQQAVDRANANLASSGRMLDFKVDAATGITIAMIINTKTGAVMQQMPGADVIKLAQMLADWSPGKHMLLDLIA